jgi:hypothetical protein
MFSARFGKIGPSWSLSVVAMKRRRGRTVRPFSFISARGFEVCYVDGSNIGRRQILLQKLVMTAGRTRLLTGWSAVRGSGSGNG